ncbi:GntR family transcriptional regulator [Metabacillus bambusae]|uniref:GntR family transcriptional regulator n=1 Tax=Metabacillus bambusae TaxID=2795218 RepID=A0ABS3N170_9BACI|nr:GntR family transcriptional regulator [Metabacillus bambusae]MBO1512011.1 GntR family transcriptional regulator [Metabacillus bambusae]
MNTPLYEKIYDFISEQIKLGHLKYGERVPSEKELAEEFNVSRITSKKALDLLSQNKLIERIRGKGSFVMKNQTVNKEERQTDLHHQDAKDSKLIALIIQDFDDAFGLKLVKTIEETCLHYNCNLIIRRTGGQIIEEENAIKDLVNFGVEGLIIFPIQGEHYNTELLKLVLMDFPLVLVDRYLRGIPASAVSTNNQSASEELTNYLFSLGHKDVAFLSPSPKGISTIEERVQGFHIAYSKQGIKLNPNFILYDLISSLPQNDLYDYDYQGIKSFIDDNPDVTAFIVCEYYLALALNKALNDLGKKVPEDYSVVCFDCPENSFGRASFTHIRQNELEMGKKAVDLLMKHLKGENIPKHTFIDFTLIKGKSTMEKQNVTA